MTAVGAFPASGVARGNLGNSCLCEAWGSLLDSPSPRLSIPVAVAVTLGQSEAILAIARASLRAALQRHQLLGSKADHLARGSSCPRS